MASTAASIKVVKSMTYRGGTRLWSNRYHFTNGVPADAAKWLAFSDAVVNAEKLIFHSGVTIVGTFGYDAGSDVPVYSKTYSTTGSATYSSSVGTPGEVAALLRYSTAARTPKRHPIYLFNYYHAAVVASTGPWDTLHGSMKTNMDGYGTTWVAGISDGAVTHKRCSPRGEVATGFLTSTLLTHRDFPRG